MVDSGVQSSARVGVDAWSPMVLGGIGAGLTSTLFLVFLALLAVAAIVLTVWLWPRLAGRSVRAVLGRIGLVLLVHVSVLAALAGAVNKEVQAYPTWADLLGGGAQQRIVGDSTVPGAAKVAKLQVTGRSAPKVPGGADPAAVGQLEQVTFTGPVSGLRGTGTVYLPPEYFAKESAKRNFPVVVVVAGKEHVPQRLMSDLAPAAAQLAASRANRVNPAIWAVLADSDDTARACVDAPKGPLGLTFVGQDLPWVLRDTYRTATDRNEWAIAGVADGANCALRAAMTDSDVYGAAIMLGGTAGAPDGENLYGGSAKVRSLNNPLSRLKHIPPPPIRVLVGSTRQDGTADELNKAAAPPMTVATLPGTAGTTAASWKPRMGDIARWLFPTDKQASADREGS
ncbi:alpha/beta hydrolase [Nocardiopsis rhodophaea]|uniref:alpha/beta hydrolase n=1 Tax=Nocardiopsis rhodophaea TaxID=280238 RepID=UPI0031DFF223